MKSQAKIREEVRRQAIELARERYESIQGDLLSWQGDTDWPFQGGDYPWLCELAKRAIEAGLIPELD